MFFDSGTYYKWLFGEVHQRQDAPLLFLLSINIAKRFRTACVWSAAQNF